MQIIACGAHDGRLCVHPYHRLHTFIKVRNYSRDAKFIILMDTPKLVVSINYLYKYMQRYNMIMNSLNFISCPCMTWHNKL